MSQEHENQEALLTVTSLDMLIELAPYGEELRQVLDMFIPLALSLPQLRDSPGMMSETIKATATNGITDIATSADSYLQEELKKQVEYNHSGWQFWGEEGEDRATKYDESKSYLFITDPIEGTNNFKAHKDGSWGSVVALVDNSTKEPVVGVIADPVARIVYMGTKDGGAYIVKYAEDGSISGFSTMQKQPDEPEFTYNNSPHFEAELSDQVQRFFDLGTIQPDNPGADDLARSRKRVIVRTDETENTFVDPESGALEAIRNRGTIYFKTSNEMAAVFVIIDELGGNLTDAEGEPWKLGIDTLIAARNREDYEYLSLVYKKTLN